MNPHRTENQVLSPILILLLRGIFLNPEHVWLRNAILLKRFVISEAKKKDVFTSRQKYMLGRVCFISSLHLDVHTASWLKVIGSCSSRLPKSRPIWTKPKIYRTTSYANTFRVMRRDVWVSWEGAQTLRGDGWHRLFKISSSLLRHSKKSVARQRVNTAKMFIWPMATICELCLIKSYFDRLIDRICSTEPGGWPEFM